MESLRKTRAGSESGITVVVAGEKEVGGGQVRLEERTTRSARLVAGQYLTVLHSRRPKLPRGARSGCSRRQATGRAALFARAALMSSA